MSSPDDDRMMACSLMMFVDDFQERQAGHLAVEPLILTMSVRERFVLFAQGASIQHIIRIYIIGQQYIHIYIYI